MRKIPVVFSVIVLLFIAAITVNANDVEDLFTSGPVASPSKSNANTFVPQKFDLYGDLYGDDAITEKVTELLFLTDPNFQMQPPMEPTILANGKKIKIKYCHYHTKTQINTLLVVGINPQTPGTKLDIYFEKDKKHIKKTVISSTSIYPEPYNKKVKTPIIDMGCGSIGIRVRLSQNATLVIRNSSGKIIYKKKMVKNKRQWVYIPVDRTLQNVYIYARKGKYRSDVIRFWIEGDPGDPYLFLE